MKEFKRTGKKVLSVFLAALMVMTAWVFVAPEAKAATAGTYYYKVEFRVTDDMDNVQLKTTLYGRKNNGTGDEVVIATKDYTSDTTFKNTMTLMSGTTAAGVFPTRLRVYDNNGANYYWGRNLKGYWSVYAGSSSSSAGKMYLNASYNKDPNVEKMEKGDGTDAWWYWEVKNTLLGGKTNTFDLSYSVSSDYYPKASSISMGGGSTSLTVPTNDGGSVSSNAYTGTVYDQYGVSWYQDPTFSCNYTDKVSMNGNKLVATNAKSNSNADYDVTVTAKCGDASATKTCKISTWNYNATFYDENGTTILKATQDVVYGNSATPPANPTKNYDSENHYTFKTWEPTVGPLTSGAQKVDYIAKYDATPHSYNSEVVQEATCTEKGTTKYTCDCGYTYTAEDIPATGHDFSDKDTSETFLKSAATCTEAAVYYYKCANCGISSKGITDATYTVGDPLGHDFSNETVEERYLKSEATCLNKAVYYKSCSRCGEKGTDTFETGNALGHSFTEKSMTAEYLKSAATCTAPAEYYFKCSRCSEKGTETYTDGEKLGHDFTSKTMTAEYLKSAATCTAPAEYYFKCSRCSEKGTETYTVGEKLGHSFTQQEMTDAYLKTAATCESNAVYYYKCSRCSEKGTDTYEKTGSALGHDWDDGVITTSPTCEGAGVKTFHCKRDNSHTKTEAVSATGHSWNEDYTVDIPATCTTDGQKSIHCKTSGCDAIKPGSEVVIAALDHDWGNWEITLKETCTTPGSEKRVCKRDNNHVETRERKALGHNFNVEDISDDFLKTPADCTNAAVYYYKCANCGVSSEGIDETKTYSYGDPLGHTPGAEATCTTNQICTVCKAELHPALGHDWETEWTVDIEQTCTTVGSKSHHCTRCDEKNDVTEIPMDPHSFEWVIDQETTCYLEGSKHEKCKNCDYEQSFGTVIEKIAHTPGDWEVTTAPTCTKTGEKKIFCTVPECHAELNSEVIPANGHTDGEWIIDKDSSCTEVGSEHQICSVCKETLRTKEIPLKEHTPGAEATCTTDQTCTVCGKVLKEKLGHISVTDAAVDPTCTKTGLTEGSHCGRCNETLKKQNTVLALGHIYPTEGTKHEATCTMSAYVEYVCTREGCTVDEIGHSKFETLSGESALGHELSDWKDNEDKKPTCTTAGEQYRTCTRTGCDYKETREVASLGHDMKAGEYVPATCTSAAYTPYTCQRDGCDFSYNLFDAEHPATDHTWETTTSQEGNVLTITCECSVCHKTHTKTVEVDEVHNYSVVSEVKAATCKEAGKIKITCDGAHKEGCTEFIEVETPANANAHNYETTKVDATCKEEGYVLSKCSICGNEIKTTLPITKHSYDGEVTKEASCTENGEKTFTCSICGDTYTEVIAQLPHNFEKTETVAPTCNDGGKSGYEVWTCSSCGASYEKVTDEKIAHNWGDWETVQDATDKLKGIKKRTCSVCGEVQFETTEPIGDHNFVEVEGTKKAPTCTADGTVEMKCTASHNCGVTYTATLPKLGHNMKVTESVAATCEHEGYDVYTCENGCGNTYNVVTALASAHVSESVTQVADCLNPSVTYTYCKNCEKLLGNVTVGKALGHDFTREVSFTAPTNDKNGEKVLGCSRCDATITVVLPAEGHEFELVSTKDATCSETGLETYKCKTHTGDNDCGLSYTDVIPMKEHTYATKVKTAATCTTAGEGKFYCTVCSETFGEYQIPALGHDFSVVTETVASTCNTVGYVTKQCSRCEETETTYSSTLAEHSWSDWKVEQEKTDVLPKIEVRKCSVCGVYDYRTEAPSGKHVYNDGEITKAPTCTEEGEKTFTCIGTDCACTDGNRATYTVKIAPTGHNAKVEYKKASCTEEGYVKAVCQNENCPLSGRVIDEKTVPMEEHIEKVTITDPTCTTPGSKVYTCAVCGATTRETETIPTVPHAYKATDEFVEATCTSPKYEKYRCTYCSDEKLVKVSEATGHTVDETKTKTVDATCTTAGSVSKYCSCGQLLSVDVINPTEHTWETVTVDLKKECDGANVTYEKCSVCGAVKADSVSITESGEHEYVVTTETPATCTAAGTLVITCNHCQNVNAKVEIPAVGHTYDEGVLTEGTCTKDGVVTFTCTREGCTDAQTGHTLTKNIGKKSHNYITSGAVPATCTSSGYQLYKCEYCDTEFKEILEAPASHVYEKQSTSTEPNCYRDGHYYFKCKNCDAAYDYVVSKTGNHEYSSEVTQEKTCTLPEITTYTCKTEGCGESYTKVTANPTGHSFGDWKITKEPTDTENGEQVRKCKNCDETETAPVPAKIHNWSAAPIATTEATCTAAATETYQCTGCDICNAENGYATYVKTVGVPLQHNVVVDYQKPTCEKDGLNRAYCTLCNKEFKNDVLPATGHSFNTYLQGTYVASTCQTEGKMTFACNSCGKTQDVTIDVNPAAHNMVVDDANSQTATCTKAGYTAYKCANEGCTHVYKEWTSDPTAHTAKDEWIVKKNATCSGIGYEVLECKDCGAVMDTREIPADANLHNWKTVTEKADHTKSGYSYEQCETCGAMRNFKTEDLIKHEYTERVAYVPATPEANGSVTYRCSCGDEKTFVIPATGCKFKENTDSYVAPTCTTDGTKYYVCTIHTDCENNYEETVPALGHKAGDVELTPATCIAEGSAVVNCVRDNCGAELSRVTIEKLPHTFDENHKTVVESTCQTHGFVTYTCTTEGCDATLETTLSLAEHKYQKVSSVEPTCLDSGYDVFKCEYCDSEYHYVTVSAKGHSYELVKTEEATCSTNGHVYYECKNCPADSKAKYDYDIPATGNHTYTETVTVEPTCETAGYTYIKCADCDSIKKDSVKSTDPLGHNYTVDMGNGVMKCARCDKTIVAQKVITDESGVHSLVGTITKTPTCTEEGVMTYVCQNHKDCKQNHSDPIPVTDHYVTADSIVKTDPKCMADGTLVDGSLVVNCAHCGEEISRTVLPASHNFKITKVEKPNCKDEGRVTEVCEDCGYTRCTHIEIDPSAHNFDMTTPVMEIKATCETDGYTVYKCTHCDAQKIVKTSEKLNHKNVTVTTVDAKCEADGYKRTTCADCGKILSEEKIPMTGHKTIRTVTVDATCTKAGSITEVCADCEKILSVTVTDPTGHTWGEWKRVNGATCEKEGTEERTCLKCDEKETRQVGKGQHVYEVYKVVAPTCESEGYTIHKCRVCGHTYNDNYVQKTAHKYDGSMVVIVEPTCHSTGLKAQKCVYCGKVDPDKTNYYEIKMLSHNYGDWTVLEYATCDSNGLKQRTCINEGCPEGFEGHTETKVISKIGHNYGEWTVTKEATCIAEGERQRTCDRCGYVEKEATAKGEHKRVPDYPVEPTCTSYGLTGGNHCEVCGEVFVAQQVIPMKNHLDINGDGKCDGCGSPTYVPGSTDTCLCHKTGIASIFYKIARFFWKILRINQTCVCGDKHY